MEYTTTMTMKKRIAIKDTLLKKQIKENERKGIKKDFFELLKRATATISNKTEMKN